MSTASGALIQASIVKELSESKNFDELLIYTYLEILRGTKAGALPGKALVVFDPHLGIAVDVFPCEDGHAQERSLLSAVANTIQPQDVSWLSLIFRRHFGFHQAAMASPTSFSTRSLSFSI